MIYLKAKTRNKKQKKIQNHIQFSEWYTPDIPPKKTIGFGSWVTPRPKAKTKISLGLD